jgi:hypothetical protein
MGKFVFFGVKTRGAIFLFFGEEILYNLFFFETNFNFIPLKI